MISITKTFAERVKLKPRERKKTETGLILTANKILTKLPILLAQINAANNSYKLKNETRHTLDLLYQYNKITKKAKRFTTI